jgi:hypothetical protein
MMEKVKKKAQEEFEPSARAHRGGKKKFGILPQRDGADGDGEPKSNHKHEKKRGPALAYQFGSHVSAFYPLCEPY